MRCRRLGGESWYTHIPYGPGSEGAGSMTFHGVSCASGFSKSMQYTAVVSVWLFPERRPNECSPLMGSVGAFRLVLYS